ncbi:telomerase reverse transcriptase [Chloropicon primus]|uniref:Telomerase reverse transcriptase n=2 Tax=Chloropicon primus TaxID=1764295 RepID=A0A5B8MNC7_9CHLO|nr:telomerase reverse transcriptase [Chloropicon primus]UPR01209.1 telomerase reverse transcriptase [Chloropicon primus]|eukprot:QDZ21989.1 telomerase reverse transcriptase [Chloropicon primus]
MKRERYPIVLKALYGNDVQTLREAVDLLAPFETEDRRGSTVGDWRREDDHVSSLPSSSYNRVSQDGLDMLLDETFVVFERRAPDLATWFQRARNRRESGNGRYLEARNCQRRLVLEVVNEKFKVGKSGGSGNTDVLCIGYKKVNGASGRGRSMNAMDLPCSSNGGGHQGNIQRTFNSSVPADLLSTTAWQGLLTVLGRDILKYILMHSSVFVTQTQPRGRKYYLQACGYPVNSYVYKKAWQAKHLPPPAPGVTKGLSTEPSDPEERLLQFSDISTNPELDESYRRTVKDQMEKGARWWNDLGELEDVRMLDSEGSLHFGDDEGGLVPLAELFDQEPSQPRKRKAVRLPAWKRRKEAKMTERQDQEMVEPAAALPNPTTHGRTTAMNAFEGNGSAAPAWKKQPKKDISGSLKVPRPYLFNVKWCLTYTAGSGLPRKHILLGLTSDVPGSMQLLQDIFSSELRRDSGKAGIAAVRSGSQKPPGAKVPNCVRHLCPMARHLIKAARVCPYFRLLKESCPDPVEMKRKGILFSESENVLDYSTSPKQLGDFVWSVITFITPKILLGSKSNRRALRNAIHKFLCKKRYEEMTMQEAVFNMKVKEFDWFCPSKQKDQKKRTASQHRDYSNLLKRWIFWVFTRLVNPLVLTNFYVTQAEGRGWKVFYVRHSCWKKACMSHMDGLCNGGKRMLKEVEKGDLKQVLQRNHLGVSHLRFLPKRSTGVRLILNQSKRTDLSSHLSELDLPGSLKEVLGQFKRRPINSFLREAHCAIQHEVNALPGVLGTSGLSLSEAQRKLSAFLHKQAARGASQKFYVVSCDVEKAYDSVDANHLISMVDDIFQQDEYEFFKFTRTNFGHGTPFTKTTQACGALPPNSDFEVGFSKHANEVLLNKASSSKVKASALQAIVREHLLSNVILGWGKFYKQTVGIPQGSTLSALLCSLYLANLEVNRIFPLMDIESENVDALRFHLRHSKGVQGHGVGGEGGPPPLSATLSTDPSHGTLRASTQAKATSHQSTILRYVDDFLYITSSEEDARKFLKVMHQGFPEYNCYMNKKKTSCNFSVDGSDASGSRNLWIDGKGSAFLKWCGMLINANTLEIQRDLTQDTGGVTNTVLIPPQPGNHLKAKLYRFMQFDLKNASLFDFVINSPEVVRLNVYQVFLVGATKCEYMLSHMVSSPPLVDILYDAISSSLSHVVFRVRKHQDELRQLMRDPSCDACKNGVVKITPESHIRWLGYQGFLGVLKRKQTRHAAIIARLECDLKDPDFECLHARLAGTLNPDLRRFRQV